MAGELAAALEDDDHDSFADTDENEEELQDNEIIIKNDAEAEGTTV